MLGPLNSRRTTRGGSLVELMVGLALGLLVLAVALAGLAHQTADSRQLLTAARLDHDVQAVAHLVVRHLRRAGRWADAEDAVWRPGAPPGPANPHTLPGEDALTDRFDFAYDPTAEPVDAATPTAFGVRLHQGVLQFLLGGAAWQGLTDPQAVEVAAFTVDLRSTDVPLGVPCPQPCAGGDACAPRARQVAADLRFTADAVRLPRWQRTSERHVQLRNGAVVDGCAT